MFHYTKCFYSIIMLCLCFSIGKGPLKSFYEGEIAKKKLEKVSICTLWLEAEDYPLLLGQLNLC